MHQSFNLSIKNSPYSKLISRIYTWFRIQYLLETEPYTLKIKHVNWRNQYYGECGWLLDSRSCTIRYDSNIKDIKVLSSTILHELWHLKQFAEYKLIHLINNKWMWRGRLIETTCEYSPPWEKEARRHERLLMDQIAQDSKFIKISSSLARTLDKNSNKNSS